MNLPWVCFLTGYVLDCSHFYWSKAFPLYGRNYNSVIEAIDKMEKDLPGFFYAGKSSAYIFSLTFFLAFIITYLLSFFAAFSVSNQKITKLSMEYRAFFVG